MHTWTQHTMHQYSKTAYVLVSMLHARRVCSDCTRGSLSLSLSLCVCVCVCLSLCLCVSVCVCARAHVFSLYMMPFAACTHAGLTLTACCAWSTAARNAPGASTEADDGALMCWVAGRPRPACKHNSHIPAFIGCTSLCQVRMCFSLTL